MYQRILVPVDGSPASHRGLQEAVALARSLNARLRLLHVIDEFALTMDLGGASVDSLRTALHRYAEQILEAGKRRAGEQGVQAETATRLTAERRVAHAVLAEAADWKADVIVMGTNGRRGLSHLMLGSDAEVVLKSSPVPVLLVRPQQTA